MTKSPPRVAPPTRVTPFSKLIPAANRKSIYLFIAVNFLWWAGLYLYVPVLPVYIKDTGASLGMVGAVLAAYAIPQALFRIPLGIWSDKLGKRKFLVATGIIFTSAGALGLGLATTPWSLFFSRFITGIGAATWLVFPLYFTAYYPSADSGKAIGIINFVRSIALIAATAAGGFIAEGFGITRPFLTAALLGVFALGGLLLTRESAVRGEATVSYGTLHIATRPLLLVVSGMGILLHFAVFTGVFGFIPIYGAGIGASEGELGLITMINLGFSALGALGAIWIWQKLGYRQAIFWSALLMSLSIFAIPFTGTFFTLAAVQIPNGLSNGVLMTLFMILSIHGVPREQQATAMGVFQAVYAIGMLAGPLTSGFLGSSLSLSAVFYLAALLVLIIALLAFLPVFPKRTDG